MKHHLMVILVFLMSLWVMMLPLPTLQAAAPLPSPGPEIITVNPITNSQAAPLNTSISAVFNQPMQPSSITWRTFAVQAKQTGWLSGSLAVQANTLHFTPTRPLKAGELVQVSVTTSTRNTTGTAAVHPTVWQFRGATTASTGQLGDSGQQLNSLSNAIAQLGDLNQDGNLDLVLGPVIWFNQGGGQFRDKGYRLGDTTTQAIDFGDVDGDGDLDALLVMLAGSHIWLNNGVGQFSQSYPLSPGVDGVLADLDGDGDMDALLGQALWFNNGMGQFSLASPTLGSHEGAVAVGDIDNDGDLDALISPANSPTNQIWRNNGQGEFTLSGTVGQVASRKILLADLNNDFFLDAFVSETNSFQSTAWLNDGQGNFTQIGEQIRDSVTHTLALGDLDGDRDLDLFLARSNNETDQVWFNQGNSNFISSPQTLGQTNSQVVVLGDLDQDGDLDAVVGNGNQPSRVWLNAAPPDLSLQQTATPYDTIVTYTFTISNLGLTVAQEGYWVNQLPSYSELLAVSLPYSYTNGVVSLTLPDLLPQTQTQISLRVRFTALPAEVTTLVNTTSVTLNDDFNPSNNVSSYTLVPQAQADLVVSSNNNKSMLRPSEKITYTLTVKNIGGREALSVTLTDQLPDHMTLLGASNGVTVTSQQVTWLIDRLGAGQTISRTLTLQIDKSLPAGTDFLTNTATITYLPHPFTSTLSSKQVIEADVVVALFDLMISQSDERTVVYSGEVLTYTLIIKNNGTQDATEVSLSNVLPDMVTFLNASGGAVWNNGTLIWDNLTIASETSLTETFQVRLLTPTLGTIPLTNTATVKATLPDPTPSNNISTDINLLKITGTAKLSITVEAPTSALVGETIGYTISLSHAPESSQSPLTAIQVTSDLIPTLTQLTHDEALDLGESWFYRGNYTIQLNNPPILRHIINTQALDLNGDKVTATTEITTLVPVVRLSQVSISGPVTGTLGVTYSFMATVSPLTVTPPLNYIWQATDQTNVIRNNRLSLTDTVQWSWASVGVKQITVNVINADSLVVGTQSFTVRGPDTPPSIRDVFISPNPPKDDDNLGLFYTYVDPEGDKEGFTQIRWSVAGVPRPELNNLKTITANLTTPDESWCVTITPYDTRGITGTTTAPNCVTVVRNPFVCQANNVELLSVLQNSQLPRLKLNYTVSCPQKQTVQAQIRWYRDGVFQPGLNNRTEVLSDLVIAREAWTATVAACSETKGCERPVTSNVVYVTEKPNTPPVATVTISPTAPLDRDNLTVNVTVFDSDTSARQDPYQTQIRWYRDDILNPAFNNQTSLMATETYPGDTWCVVVLPYDGLDYGTATAPVCVMIGTSNNHAPQVTQAQLGANRAPQGTILMLSYHYQDLDNDLENPSLRQVRWYRNNQLQPAFNNQSQLPANVTLAGELWWAKVRAHDGKMSSIWVKTPPLSITDSAGNTPPAATQAEIQLTADNHLNLVYHYHDVDGQTETNTQIYWYNNPFTRTPKFDGLTVIPQSETQPNEVWYAQIIPEDGQVYGNILIAHSVRTTRQQNSPPYVRNIKIDPAYPADDDSLKLQYIYLDPDNDAEDKTVLQWELNGLKQSSFEGKNLVPHDFTDLTDKWCAFVTPVDLRGAAGETKSICVIVGQTQNTLPEISHAVITPAIAPDSQNLTLSYDYYDADGDEETQTQIRWYKIAAGGQAKELQNSLNDRTVVPASMTQPGEQWFATILGHDGKNYSAALTQTQTALINHPPQAQDLKLVPDNARASQRIRISYVFTDADPTTLSWTEEIRWFIDGQPQTEQDDQNSFPDGITRQNQVLSVTLRPHDGVEYGNKITASIKIGPPPGPTYLPLLIKTLRPLDPTATPTLTPSPTPAPCSAAARYEPNNEIAQSCEIKLGQLIEQTYPDDEYDVYHLILTETASIMVQVTNYTKPNAQAYDGVLQVFNSQRTVIAKYDTLNGIGIILPTTAYPHGLKNLPPGVYYIRVYTPQTTLNPNIPYTLQTMFVTPTP